MDNHPQSLTDQLRADLLNARKARDQLTSTTLEGLLAAIDNAGAVPVPKDIISTEAPRRELSAQDIQKIIHHEIDELQSAIQEIGNTQNTHAGELYQRIAILEEYLQTTSRTNFFSN